MKEPKPLLREGASDFERQLLSAVMRERPSPQLRSRMRSALGLTGPIAWVGSAKAMLSALAGKGVIAVAVVGCVAAGVVGVRSIRSARDAAREAAATSATTATPPAPAAERPAPSLPTSVPEQPAGNRELREEILLLDQVRAALRSGSERAAVEQLDAYRQRFPAGMLSREAAQLRQQASSAARVHAPGRGPTPRAARLPSSER
jgi:hypothetical protein